MNLSLFADDENPHTKIKENIVFRDHAKDKREVEAYKSSRQTVLCSATIPQRLGKGLIGIYLVFLLIY